MLHEFNYQIIWLNIVKIMLAVWGFDAIK